MSEYDVEAEIRVDDSSARGATARLAAELHELTRLATTLGHVLTQVFKGMRPEVAGLASSVHAAASHMKILEASTGKLTTQIRPLAASLRQTHDAVSRLEQTSTRSGVAMTNAFRRAGSATGGLSSMLRSTLAIAGAYVGFRALSSVFTSLVSNSFTFASAMDKNRISLSAILAATQPALTAIKDQTTRMAQAGQLGDAIFRQLQDDALKSVATSQEMQSIYAQIAGPLAGAGAKLSEIRQITKDTVSAASVLGVDFAQASRDIMLMSTGAAGMDTMLFRMLKSTRRITESTQQWNEMLPEKRLRRLQEALSGFAPAAEAFEKTLPGITSSFIDYMQRFRGMFFSGPLDSMRKALVRFVEIFRSNETKISALLKTMGDAFARWLEPALNAFTRATEWFLQNWETIAARVQRSIERWAVISSTARSAAQHYGPSIGAGAKTLGAGILLGRFAPGAVGAVTSGVSAGLAGSVGGGGAAGAIASSTHLISVIAAMGGTFTILLPVLAAVVGVLGVLIDGWSHLVLVFGAVWTLIQDVFGVVWGLLSNVAGALFSLAKIIGAVIGSIVLLGGAITLFIANTIVWRGILKPVLAFVGLLFELLATGLEWVYQQFLWLFTKLADLFAWLNKDLLPKSGGGSTPGFFDALMTGFADAMAKFESQSKADQSILGAAESGAPGARKVTVNDFRGSKIEVKQDFRQADPDRVWLQFVEGINDAAEQRLASALVPDFTR